MKQIFVTVLLIFGVIILVGLGSVLLVLWAYGAGQVLLRVLPEDTFTSFEATLLNQVGVLIMGLIMVRAVSSSATTKPLAGKITRNDRQVEEAWEKDDGTENEADELAGIPRWRRPLKNIDFTDVKPNDPCPCGSGRKFQNCHGFKRSDVK
jgi:hypothetical protein